MGTPLDTARRQAGLWFAKRKAGSLLSRYPSRFQAKWAPVRVKKTRQTKRIVAFSNDDFGSFRKEASSREEERVKQKERVAVSLSNDRV
jgi:hypothetical protein